MIQEQTKKSMNTEWEAQNHIHRKMEIFIYVKMDFQNSWVKMYYLVNIVDSNL